MKVAIYKTVRKMAGAAAALAADKLSRRIAENGRATFMVYCAAQPSRCKGIPGLRRWKRALAMETFCSTPEERQIVENQSGRRRPEEQDDHAMD